MLLVGAGQTLMGVLFSLLLPLSITIDNVVVGQNISLPPTRVAVISKVIHLASLMLGVSLAPHITPYLPASKHMISPALFTILGMLSLWTACHHKPNGGKCNRHHIFKRRLAFDALLLGLKPALTDMVKIVIFGVLVFSPLFVCIGRATCTAGLKFEDDLAVPRPQFSVVWLDIQCKPLISLLV